MSDDYIDGAIDLLETDATVGYLLIAAHFGNSLVTTAAHCPTRAHQAWLRRRFEDACEKIEAGLPEELDGANGTDETD